MMQRRAGFTMIEVAIMLAVLGLVVGLGVSLIGPLGKRSKLVETLEAVKQAKEALIGFAVQWGYLPDGEAYDPDRVAQAFQEVGVRGTDANRRPLLYVPAEELQHRNSPCIAICSYPKTSLKVYHSEGSVIHNVAFVLVSAGENRNIQTGVKEEEETDADGKIVKLVYIYGMDSPDIDDNPYDMIRREPYDDVVEYVSLSQLQALRACPPLRITTPELPVGYEGKSYTAQIAADGEDDSEYTWKMSVCPSGLSCVGNTLSGVPAAGSAGAYVVTAEVSDGCGRSAQKTFGLTIHPASSGGSGGGGGGG
ncbi:putative Ig domain-containing protein, partial [Desulfosoma sp.]